MVAAGAVSSGSSFVGTMLTEVYTQAELEAAGMAMRAGKVSVNNPNLRAGAQYILDLADRIRNERAVAAMNR
jgi:hypothetical protein